MQSTGSQRAGHKGSDLALTQSVQGAPADRRRQEQSRKGKGVGTTGQRGPDKDERGDALSAVRVLGHVVHSFSRVPGEGVSSRSG